MQLKGSVQYNSVLDIFDLVFWVEDAGQVVSTDLGLLNYQLRDRNGVNITASGAFDSDISPNMQGMYVIDEIQAPTFISNNELYLLYVECTVDANPLSTYIPFRINTI
jgi:hypothetical protein